MIPVVMAQMDYLRSKDGLNTVEIKQLKDRLRVFEATSSTAFGFKGFSHQ